MFNKLITPDIFYDINIPSELKHVFHEKKNHAIIPAGGPF